MEEFRVWVNRQQKLNLSSYAELYEWSISDLSIFWKSIWDYFDILHSGSIAKVLDLQTVMIGSKWFTGTQVNYAEHLFRRKNNLHPAITFKNENEEVVNISWETFENETAKLAHYYRFIGLGKGSRIAAFLPNIPEAIIAFAACSSIGAIWTSCSPDFGTKSVVERFSQIEPDLLLVANGYQYNGKVFSKAADNEALIQELPTLKKVVSVRYHKELPAFEDSLTISWNDLPSTSNKLEFTRLDFNDPLWVLYSSGTTGLPKAITHSVGGTLLEHLKALVFHQNVQLGDPFFWFSTTGWMMWNYANAALLAGGNVVIYDGSPSFPNLNCLWDLADKTQLKHFGAGASFYISCMKAEIQLNRDLPLLESLGSTGSPLTPEAFNWIYKTIKEDLWLISLSGGTDICSGFVGGNPYEPVIEGEIQCRMLGVDLQAFNGNGNPVLGELGEMVIQQPMPSMPIYFWNDRENEKYHSSYFEMYPGIWRHGDWIKISDRGSVVIYGRSDSTLNRGGVRIGTSEVYNAVESLPFVKDSIVVCIDQENGNQQLILFVQAHTDLKAEEIASIKGALRTQYSPRHVPDLIEQAPEIPYTISGKKMETAVKAILSGNNKKKIAKDAMKNPDSLAFYQAWAAENHTQK